MDEHNDKGIEEKVAEFNKIDSNDTILGNYLRIYTEFILDEADEGDRINRIQDERINNWLRQALHNIATQAREEERGRMREIIEQVRDTVGFDEETATEILSQLKD